MSATSFRSVFMVASCAGAALGCYLVSLRVASERAALEDVETKIVLAQRDLRVLQTEIGTRGRLAQLERWNVKVLALSAPSADQFLGGSFELARLTAPGPRMTLDAPVVLASATAPDRATPVADGEEARPGPQPAATGPAALMREASLTTSSRAEGEAAAPPPRAAKVVDKSPARPARPLTKPARLANIDPLAPLPGGASAAKDSPKSR